jgi:hypothetical protein
MYVIDKIDFCKNNPLRCAAQLRLKVDFGTLKLT